LYYIGIATATQTGWIAFWFFFALSKFGNVFAQVEICRPPTESEQNTNINGKEPSPFRFDSNIEKNASSIQDPVAPGIHENVFNSVGDEESLLRSDLGVDEAKGVMQDEQIAIS